MEQMVIALDVDGTLFDGTEVAAVAVDALQRASAAGHRLVVVTGRQWSGLDAVLPSVLHLFDRVVCEEGGVLVDVTRGSIRLLGEPVDPRLVEALHDAGVPSLDIGLTVIGAPAAYADALTAVRDRHGSSRRLVTNKASVALAPAGCDKGTGLLAAIADLGSEGRTIIAIGDAENDLPMFAVANIAVGVANADAAVLASGVEVTSGAAGNGVAEALARHLPTAGEA